MLKCYLTHHLNKHNGKKRFHCHVCFKDFNQKGHLNRHFITHTKEKPFQCDVCDKSFTRKDSVKLHMLVHILVRKIINVMYVKRNILKNVI